MITWETDGLIVSSIHGREVEIVSAFGYFAPTFGSVAIWILGTGQRGLEAWL